MRLFYFPNFMKPKKDMEHLLKMDSQFHEVLFESCGSKMLEHQLKDYHQYVQKARKLRSLIASGTGQKINTGT